MVKRRRSYLEMVAIALVVALTVALGAGIYAGRAKSLKSDLLIHELSMMRSSLLVYKIVNRRNAKKLEQLATSSYFVHGDKRPYIDELPPVRGGKIIDPFGNPYSYDPKTGWVSSATPGFVQW